MGNKDSASHPVAAPPGLSASHSHGGNSLDLNGCWVVDALLFRPLRMVTENSLASFLCFTGYETQPP